MRKPIDIAIIIGFIIVIGVGVFVIMSVINGVNSANSGTNPPSFVSGNFDEDLPSFPTDWQRYSVKLSKPKSEGSFDYLNVNFEINAPADWTRAIKSAAFTVNGVWAGDNYTFKIAIPENFTNLTSLASWATTETNALPATQKSRALTGTSEASWGSYAFVIVPPVSNTDLTAVYRYYSRLKDGSFIYIDLVQNSGLIDSRKNEYLLTAFFETIAFIK